MADNPAYAARAKARSVSLDKARELSEADLKTAREQFRAVMDADQKIRKRLLSDHRYIDGASEDAQGNPVGQQWTVDERQERASRPTMEIDALSGPISQVSNALADSKPAADMHPIGGGADTEKAEV